MAIDSGLYCVFMYCVCVITHEYYLLAGIMDVGRYCRRHIKGGISQTFSLSSDTIFGDWLLFRISTMPNKKKNQVALPMCFNMNNIIFAKLRGYAIWPAKVSNCSIHIFDSF